MKRVKYILFVLFFLAVTVADAQRFTSRKRYWSGGVALNGMNYFGDITPKDNITSFDISFTRPQIGFFATRRLTPRFSARVALNYGTLKGDDFDSNNGGGTEFDAEDQRFRAYRNQHFRNRIAELSVVGIFDLVQNRGFYYKRPEKPIPYIFGGIAVFTNNPQARAPYGEYSSTGGARAFGNSGPWSEDVRPGEWVTLRDKELEGISYSGIQIGLPVGLGVRYRLTDKLDIAFEAGFRWTFTDYLDDVSGRYIAHDANSLNSYLSDRSLAFASADKTGTDRSPLINDNVNGFLATYPDPSVYSQPVSSTFPGERRGNDGSDLESFSEGKPGPFSGANDIYMVYGIHLSYIFAVQVKCPKFR